MMQTRKNKLPVKESPTHSEISQPFVDLLARSNVEGRELLQKVLLNRSIHAYEIDECMVPFSKGVSLLSEM
jgi:hypothetical protein